MAVVPLLAWLCSAGCWLLVACQVFVCCMAVAGRLPLICLHTLLHPALMCCRGVACMVADVLQGCLPFACQVFLWCRAVPGWLPYVLMYCRAVVLQGCCMMFCKAVCQLTVNVACQVFGQVFVSSQPRVWSWLGCKLVFGRQDSVPL
jgi:hypothetical protein